QNIDWPVTSSHTRACHITCPCVVPYAEAAVDELEPTEKTGPGRRIEQPDLVEPPHHRHRNRGGGGG
ncbi:hypothetical protein DPEC_G00274940, partial [Dallia pectoralis]